MVERKKLLDYVFFFTAVWNGVQITCGSEYRHAIPRVSIVISHFVFHSL